MEATGRTLTMDEWDRLNRLLSYARGSIHQAAVIRLALETLLTSADFLINENYEHPARCNGAETMALHHIDEVMALLGTVGDRYPRDGEPATD